MKNTEEILEEIKNILIKAKKEHKEVSKNDMHSFSAGWEMGILVSI